MDHHKKITLNLRDVKHLQSQFTKDATNKLNLYLPTTDNSDPLKNRVSELVNDFIFEIFERSKDSLEIDGSDGSTSLRKMLENPTNEVEPFDFSLQEQVRKLYQEVENETIRLTKLRKETPQNFRSTYEESFQKSFSVLQEFQKEIEELETAKYDDDDSVLIEREKTFTEQVKPKLEEMTFQYEESIKTLKEIKDNIPEERSELAKLEQITKFLKEKD